MYRLYLYFEDIGGWDNGGVDTYEMEECFHLLEHYKNLDPTISGWRIEPV